MNKAQLKEIVEKAAEEAKSTEIEIITAMQSEAASRGADSVLETLCELKWDYI